MLDEIIKQEKKARFFGYRKTDRKITQSFKENPDGKDIMKVKHEN